jgi:hypothetical protein
MRVSWRSITTSRSIAHRVRYGYGLALKAETFKRNEGARLPTDALAFSSRTYSPAFNALAMPLPKPLA